MILSRLELRTLLGNEMLQFITQGISIVKNEDPKLVPNIATNCDKVETFIPLLQELMSKDAQSEWTEKIVATDALRDQCIIGIKEVASGFSRHYVPAKASAGAIVLRAIEKHGNIADKTYNAESAVIDEVLMEANNVVELKNAITQLGITDWFAELKKSNDAFNTIYIERVKERGNQPQARVVDKRKEASDAYKKLMDTVQSAANLSDNGAYDVLITNLNELVSKYKTLLAKRKAAKKEKGEQK